MTERRGTKALELWCRRITDGYPGVNVQNMTTSWRDGLAFCAMIHHFRPDLIDFDSLNKDDVYGNNELAFRTAAEHLGIPALLDAEDMASCSVPDRLSILTYLSQFYQNFGGSSPSRLALSRTKESSNEGLTPVVAESTKPKVGPRTGMRREPCAVCGMPVFLAEKLMISRTPYHRTCFRCARCNDQLTPGNYYETEEGQYCCETCPDEEEETTEESLSINSPMLNQAYDEAVITGDENSSLKKVNLTSGYNRSLSDEEKSVRRAKLGGETTNDVNADAPRDSETRRNDLTNKYSSMAPENMSQTAQMRLNFMANHLLSEKDRRGTFDKDDSSSNDQEYSSDVEDAEIGSRAESLSRNDSFPRRRSSPGASLIQNYDGDGNVDTKKEMPRRFFKEDRREDALRKPIVDSDSGASSSFVCRRRNDNYGDEELGDKILDVNVEDTKNTREIRKGIVENVAELTKPSSEHRHRNNYSYLEDKDAALVSQDTKDTLGRDIDDDEDDNNDHEDDDPNKSQEIIVDTSQCLSLVQRRLKMFENSQAINERAIRIKTDALKPNDSLDGTNFDGHKSKSDDSEDLIVEDPQIFHEIQEKTRKDTITKLLDDSTIRQNDFSNVKEIKNDEGIVEIRAIPRKKRGDSSSKSQMSSIRIDSTTRSNEESKISLSTSTETSENPDDSSFNQEKLSKIILPSVPKRSKIPIEKTDKSKTKNCDVTVLNASGIDLSGSENYPEDLNPFKSDEEDAIDVSAIPGNLNVSRISEISTNPFGSSEDEDEDVGEIVAPPRPATRTNLSGRKFERRDIEEEIEQVATTKRKLKAPRISFNPFSSDEDENDQESECESRDHSLSVHTPIPKPRTIKQTPESLRKCDIHRGDVYASNSSLASTGSTTTPGGTYRKKKPAPPPPIAKELFNSAADTTPSSDQRSSVLTSGNNSLRSTPRARKAKPAPPIPMPTSTPCSTNPQIANLSLTESPITESEKIIESREYQLWDDPKIGKDEANKNRRSMTTISYSETNPYGGYTDKSVQGKWKRKKGPAPARPIPHRRKIKVMSLKDVKLELDEIEMQQQGLEKQGVRLEQLIRDKAESGNPPEETSLGLDVEELVLELFALVNEKNELFRRQAELMLLRRQQRLEEEHADVEYQIRCLLCQPEATKTDFDKQREEALIQRLVEIVERRNEIVECLEMDRRREVEEDRSINTQMGIYAAKNKADFAKELEEDGNNRSRKSRKAKLKEKAREKILRKGHKKDADKDVDETEVKLKRQNKKKWF